MRLLVCVVLVLLGCSEVTKGDKEAGLIINEVMSRNCSESGIIAPNGKSSDWIELYNYGSQPVDLSEYFLSDDSSVIFKSNLPTVVLQPGAYITLWCGGEGNSGDLYVGFNLSKSSSSGESVILSHRELGIVDGCLYLQSKEGTKKGYSYGRLPDGGKNWSKQTYPSPSSPNNG